MLGSKMEPDLRFECCAPQGKNSAPNLCSRVTRRAEVARSVSRGLSFARLRVLQVRNQAAYPGGGGWPGRPGRRGVTGDLA